MYRCGCQETEAGDLFAKKSRWKDLKGVLHVAAVHVGRAMSLWRTAIQTVEAKHGAHVAL